MRKQLEKKVECWWKGTNIKKDEPHELIEKITRRTTGARGCYFQTSVYQVI